MQVMLNYVLCIAAAERYTHQSSLRSCLLHLKDYAVKA